MDAADNAVLGEVSAFIAERLGLDFPKERWPDLARKLQTAARELGFEHVEGYAKWLASREASSSDIQRLAGYLTIGETYFFRDIASFELLERVLLPALIEKRATTDRRLRLWSAGCCTGEEAYSLAISCARSLPDIDTWKISILGSDVNAKFLAKAEKASYSQWSFRSSPGWLKEGYFSSLPGSRFVVDPAVRKLVHFEYLNLAEDIYPSLHNGSNAMDVIFCRNVLMYFGLEQRKRVVAALHDCLLDEGCLIVNPAEATANLFPMFAMENIEGVILFRKSPKVSRAEIPSEPPPPSPSIDAPGPGSAQPSAIPPDRAPIARAKIVPATIGGARPPAQKPDARAPLSLDTARALADQGRLEEALELCLGVIAADPTNQEAHFLHAAIASELSLLGDAIEALRKVLYLDQDFILAHHALGGLYKRLGRHNESKRHFRTAFELLSLRNRDEILPGSEGMSCGRLLESIGGPGGRS
ncbi:MAG TPA: CheR family methyltransferase [Rectinemataceae bacterium]|nr:CheR family methyltransferase [Rectinemataceae bacterium]